MVRQSTHDRLTPHRVRSLLRPLLVALTAAIFLPVRAAPPAARSLEALAFIVAPATGLQDVPATVLRDAFRGLRTDYRGVRLIPFNLPMGVPAREQLDRVLLGLEPHEVGMFWVDQRVRDGRVAPRTIPSVERLVRVVSLLRGAVACVPSSAVDATVRVLRVDGKAPTDNDYLLARK